MDELLLADREMDVMGVLWDRGSGTVTEVREQLHDALAYTTVLTVLRNLERKGAIAHVVTGQAHRYVPLVARATARRTALTRLLDKLFHGAPEQLLAHMVDERSMSVDDLRRLRAQIDELEARAIDRDAPAVKSTTRRGRKP
ncbi:MAG: BlaI/MecI/CopY family transcriptional regulator [bacterium]